MPDTSGNLTVRHEMPSQLAEHRLVLKGLLVELLKDEVIRTAQQQTIWKARPSDVVSRASLCNGSLGRSWVGDVPIAVAPLALVETAQYIIEHVRRVGLRHEPHFLAKGVRCISKLKRKDKPRIRR